MTLKGKVVEVVWQDIWWEPDEAPVGRWKDSDYVHYTYGLVLRDTHDWISVAHELRPAKDSACGVTSIYKPVIRSIEVYGSGTDESADTRVQKVKRK